MIRNISISLLFLLLSVAGLRAQTSISAQAFAEIIEALTANETDQLNFGRFSTDVNGGDIIINPDGSRSIQGSLIGVSGPHSPGVFQVTGAPEASFTLQLPDGPAVLIHQETSKTMFVENWVSDPPVEEGPSVLTNGAKVISIGATLSVGSYDENPVGVYSGTFQLTFAYN
jgi:hypothetical protein